MMNTSIPEADTLPQSLPDNLKGFSRSATEQALENLAQALRVLDLTPATASELCPHPLVIVRAEIENARRSLAEQASTNASTTSH